MYCETSVSIRWPPPVDDPGERQQRDLGAKRLPIHMPDEHDGPLTGHWEERVVHDCGMGEPRHHEVHPLAVGGNRDARGHLRLRDGHARSVDRAQV